MTEGSKYLRDNLSYNEQNNNGNLQSRVDPNHKIITGLIKERNNDVDNLSKK